MFQIVTARNYGEGRYGMGLYGIGEEEVEEAEEKPAGAGASSSLGARGGGCWLLANQYKTCYYINSSECVLGCPESYECNPDYDFDLINNETLNYCETKDIQKEEQKTDIILPIIIVSAFIIALIAEEEVIRRKRKKREIEEL